METLCFELAAKLVVHDAQHLEVVILSSLRVKKTADKPEISDQIGRQLRSVYNDILAQPVPDRFLDLLKNLDGADTSLMTAVAGQEKGAK